MPPIVIAPCLKTVQRKGNPEHDHRYWPKLLAGITLQKEAMVAVRRESHGHLKEDDSYIWVLRDRELVLTKAILF